jgi:hypothetical protein
MSTGLFKEYLKQKEANELRTIFQIRVNLLGLAKINWWELSWQAQ